MYNPQSLNAYSYVVNNRLEFTDPNGEDLYAADQQTSDDIKRLAPGLKIDADGKVHKPRLFPSIWNHLSGHGKGRDLVGRLVDLNISKKSSDRLLRPTAAHVPLRSNHKASSCPALIAWLLDALASMKTRAWRRPQPRRKSGEAFCLVDPDPIGPIPIGSRAYVPGRHD